MIDLDPLIAAELPDLIRLRHDLHAHPQLGYEETYASGRVREELTRSGVPFVAGLAGTGVVGWLEPPSAQPGEPAVGLRADMDALPIEEQTELPYASTHPGLMHACGHDGHTAILVGAARVLAKLRDRLPRPVKFVFQPAEEFGAGGQKLVELGVLKETVGGRPVERMFGLHGSPYLGVGQVATRPGPLMAACTDFEVRVVGQGGHAALPPFPADPVVAACALVGALQTVVSRSLPPGRPAVVSVGRIRGGQAGNVIPDHVELAGTVRTLHEEVFPLIAGRLRELSEHVARAHGCRAEVRIIPSYPATVNDRAAAAFALRVGCWAVGPAGVYEIPDPIMASEDFAYYGRQVPSCFSFIGVRPPGRADYPPLHSPLYDFTDDAIAVGVKLMCGFALTSPSDG
jgi:amidohydrolase